MCLSPFTASCLTGCAIWRSLPLNVDARVYDSAQLLPLTTLCIAPGRSVWCLYVDATCISYDGNVFDAALLAMVVALRNSEPGPTRGVLFADSHLFSLLFHSFAVLSTRDSFMQRLYPMPPTMTRWDGRRAARAPHVTHSC